jgi:hypothetical protein
MSRRSAAAGAVILAAVALAGAGVRAQEPPPLGLSVDGYLASGWDSSVTNETNGGPQDRDRGLVGLTALVDVRDFAAGGVVDGFPGLFGGGRLTVGGLAGWQPRFRRFRWQLLGELGAERFSDVGGNLLTSPGTHETWLGYTGARLGFSITPGRGEHFELGWWLFVRRDLGEATVTNSSSNWIDNSVTTTTYHLGGSTAGAALRVGVRLDRKP